MTMFFIGASVSDQNKFYSLFDKIFLLSIDAVTLEYRLKTRTNNSFGNEPEHRQFILDIHDRVEKNLRAAGAISIDSSRPINIVADEILSHIDEN